MEDTQERKVEEKTVGEKKRFLVHEKWNGGAEGRESGVCAVETCAVLAIDIVKATPRMCFLLLAQATYIFLLCPLFSLYYLMVQWDEPFSTPLSPPPLPFPSLLFLPSQFPLLTNIGKLSNWGHWINLGNATNIVRKKLHLFLSKTKLFLTYFIINNNFNKLFLKV